MSKGKEIQKLKHFLYDFADAVSYNEETSRNYLEENGVDVDKFIGKGLKQIETTLKKKGDKKNKALFFKRVVLAAEIVYNLHNERTFGHVKLQKLMYLCERASNMELAVRYTKQAAGPFDRKFMHSIDNELMRLKWFNVDVKNGNGYNTYVYTLGENPGSYKPYFDNYYGDSREAIGWLINTFGKPTTKKVELVATIYSCLEEFIKEKCGFSPESLIEAVFNWSEEKKKKYTRENILNAYKWMVQKGLVPKAHSE